MLVDGTTGGRPGLCTSTDGGDSRPLVASWWLWSALPVLSCARALRPQMMAGSNAGSPCCSRPHRGHSRSSALHRMAENRVYRRMAAASSRRWRSPRQMTCTRAHTHAKQHVLRQETLAAAHAGNAGLPARTPTRLHETEGRRATQRAPGTSAARTRPPRTFCSTPPGTRRRTSGHSLSQKTSSAEGAPPSRWDRTGSRRRFVGCRPQRQRQRQRQHPRQQQRQRLWDHQQHHQQLRPQFRPQLQLQMQPQPQPQQ